MSIFHVGGGRRPVDGLGLGALFAMALLSTMTLRDAAAEDAAGQPSAESGDTTPSSQATPADSSQQPAPSGDAAAASQHAAADAPQQSPATNDASGSAPTDAPAPQATPSPAASGPLPEAKEPASASVVINLIRLLVQEGVLTQAKADGLIRQAQDEANAAAAAEAVAKGQGIAVPVGGQNGTAVPAGAAESAAGAAAGAESAGAALPAPAAESTPVEGALPKAQPPSIHVQYVPEIVKKQITDQVRQEVMQQAKDEHWAEPNALPEWTKRVKLDGDFRLRYEWNLFDKRNSPFFPNFFALNSGNPFDLNNQSVAPLPILNTTEDRQRLRIRARLGLTADITDDWNAGFRLATGNTTNPVSTNQTLGTTLANDTFALDRAFVQYQPTPWLKVVGGRFANPWFHTDLVWDPDLNFDGVAVQYMPHPGGKISPFATLGLFSVENTLFNFPDNSTDKVKSRDKWLYGAQAGLAYQPNPAYRIKAGLAYYQYNNIEGQRSSPCNAFAATIPCNTDNSRSQFIQFGNTLFPIRDLSPVSNGTLFQFYGLATKFQELNATFQFDYAKLAPFHIIFDGDFVTNLAFNAADIRAKNPVNNGSASLDGVNPGPWDGGANGWQARVTFGYPDLAERWDWNVYAAYKHIESDAVLDAFTDSDFHLGGTNAKGYIFGGGLGIAHNVDLSARWLSASEITGFPFTVDVIQVDLNARF